MKLFFNNNESEIIFEEVVVAMFEVYFGIYVEWLAKRATMLIITGVRFEIRTQHPPIMKQGL